MPNIIETRALTRRFGPLTAVANLDLAVPEGAVYGFLGPNGAGKTTTIRILLGLIHPDAGEVRLFDRPLAADRRAGREPFDLRAPDRAREPGDHPPPARSFSAAD